LPQISHVDATAVLLLISNLLSQNPICGPARL
jgi:hypothetical protein